MCESGLSIAHINIRSLSAHFDLFRDYVLDSAHDVIAISETWLSGDILSDAVFLPGYNLVRNDRPSHGGGVAFYVNEVLPFGVLDYTVTSDILEQLWISLDVDGRSIAVGVVYRLCHSDVKRFLDFFEDYIPEVINSFNEVICVGDFNIDLLDFECNSSRLYCAVLGGLGLYQIIKEPTRVSRTSSTLIDHISCTDKSSILDSGVVPLVGVSDHHLIYAVLNVVLPVVPPVTRTFRNLCHFDRVNFDSDLKTIPWHNIYRLASLDDKVTLFTDYILMLFDIHAPLTTKTFTRPKAPWFTPNIRLMMRMRNRIYRKCKRADVPNPNDWEQYQVLRNLTRVSQSREKRAYFDWLARINVNDSKKLWKELNRLNVNNRKSFALPDHLSDPDEINNYFATAIPHLQPCDHLMGLYTQDRLGCVDSLFDFNAVPIDVVNNAIFSIKSESMGSDSISISMLKLCLPVVLPVIAHLVNSCLVDGYVPGAWKEAIVVPIPKKHNPTEYKDIRPISILSPLAKILERLVDDQLRSYLSKYNILPIYQSGFRPGYSCSSALSLILDKIIAGIDQGLCTVVVLLDYSKAFDTINHELLLSILQYIGLSSNAIRFFKYYLSGRCQRVMVSNSVSESSSLYSGVPQGSILGPLLYLIYTSFLYSKLKFCEFHLYADDSQIFYTFDATDVDIATIRINHDLNILASESSKHCLALNASKSSAIVFGNRKSREVVLAGMRLFLDGNVLPFSQEARNLGLVLDADVRFRSQVSSMIQRAYSSLRSLYTFRDSLTPAVRKILCDSLVLSNFNYCDVVYGPCIDGNDCYRIQKVQNSCVRFIFGLNRRQHVSGHLRRLQWLNMGERRDLHLLCFYHKLIIFKHPPYLLQRLSFRTDIHNLNLRHRGLISMPRHFKAIFRRSFSYNVPALYNKLPLDAKSLGLRQFKKRIRSWIISQSF